MIKTSAQFRKIALFGKEASGISSARRAFNASISRKIRHNHKKHPNWKRDQIIAVSIDEVKKDRQEKRASEENPINPVGLGLATGIGAVGAGAFGGTIGANKGYEKLTPYQRKGFSKGYKIKTKGEALNEKAYELARQQKPWRSNRAMAKSELLKSKGTALMKGHGAPMYKSVRKGRLHGGIAGGLLGAGLYMRAKNNANRDYYDEEY